MDLGRSGDLLHGLLELEEIRRLAALGVLRTHSTSSISEKRNRGTTPNNERWQPCPQHYCKAQMLGTCMLLAYPTTSHDQNRINQRILPRIVEA